MKLEKVVFPAALLLIFAIAAFILFSSKKSSEKSEAEVLSLFSANPESPADSASLEEFSRLVEEKTGGRVKIGFSFSERDSKSDSAAILALNEGRADFAMVSEAALLEEDASAEIEELCAFGTGDISFCFPFEVGIHEGLSGLKIRAEHSPFSEAFIAEVGASAVSSIPIGEIYGKIESAIVDGAECSLIPYYTNELYIVAPFLLRTGHARSPDILLASRRCLSRLSEQDAQTVRECASLVQEFHSQKYSEHEKSVEKKLRGLATIVKLTDDKEN